MGFRPGSKTGLVGLGARFADETEYDGAIFANVIEMDSERNVLNAERRAAQWLRSYYDPTYKIEPPFEDWEVALHEAPPHIDVI